MCVCLVWRMAKAANGSSLYNGLAAAPAIENGFSGSNMAR